MAKKKAKKSKSKAARPGFGEVAEIFELLQKMAGQEPRRPRSTRKKLSPREQAQELIEEALEGDPDLEEELARQALAIYPDCSDAYLILADNAKSAEQAREYYQAAVAAAERDLGPQAFREYEGQFWLFHETRPYMQARMELGACLLDLGRLEEAVDNFREMLRLNPNDNQGVRDLLAKCLLELHRDTELGALLQRYKDDGFAAWKYTQALYAFRTQGDTPQARQQLAQALKANRHVPGLLLGIDEMPRSPPELYSIGSEDEAVLYTANFALGWKETPGAISWLRAQANIPEPKVRTRPPSKSKQLAMLQTLPLTEACWQVDVRPVPSADPKKAPMWCFAIVDQQRQPVFLDLFERRPAATTLWLMLADAMRLPKEEQDPQRPGRVEVRDEKLFRAWQRDLAKLGIELHLKDALEHYDPLYEMAMAQIARSDTEAAAALDMEQLRQLPQAPEYVWQADVRRLAMWMGGPNNPTRPWMIFVVHPESGAILRQQLLEQEPAAEAFVQQLLLAIASPSLGDPLRPGVVELSSTFAQAVGEALAPLEVRCVVKDDLPAIDTVADELSRDMAQRQGEPTALIDVPGMPLETVAEFFAAAASYYHRQPWRKVAGDRAITIACQELESGPWYAVVMGQSGMTLGLALYEDLATLRSIFTGPQSDDENFRRSTGLGIVYAEALQFPVRDLDAAERFGWAVASPESYPLAIRLNPGDAMRPPLRWELELLTACLHAVPRFLETSQSNFPFAPAEGKTLTLRLAWTA